MELLIVIAPILIVGVVGYVVISIQDWITDMRFYRRSTQRELNRLRRSLQRQMKEDSMKAAFEVGCVKTTLSTGEEQVLGPGKIYVFGEPKVGTVTGTVGYEQLEEMGATLDEAERLIKEAHDRAVD